MYGLTGLSAKEVAGLVTFQASGKGQYPMLPHGHPDSNTLINKGDYDPKSHWPSSVNKFLDTGDRPSSFFRDLAGVNNQVPRWAWFVLGGTFVVLGGMSYRQHRKSKKKSKTR